MLILMNYRLYLIVSVISHRRIEELTKDFFLHFFHKLIVRILCTGIKQ